MSEQTGAYPGFEDKLWPAEDKLIGTLQAAEDRHVVIGLIFRKYDTLLPLFLSGELCQPIEELGVVV